jgi:hypothetical protein
VRSELVEEKTIAELDALFVELLRACPPYGVDRHIEEQANRQVMVRIAELEESLSPQDLLRLQCVAAIHLGCIREFLGS